MTNDALELPRLTAARAAALEALGIGSTDRLIAWCAQRLADAVNIENERTRTTAELADEWLRAAVGDGNDQLPERIDPATLEGWADAATYTVHFQHRELSGVPQRSVFAVSHHELVENQEQRWDGWDAGGLAAWMADRTQLAAIEASPEDDPAEAELPAALASDETGSHSVGAAHVRAVYAVEGARVIDLQPHDDRPRPMLSRDPHIEVELDSSPPGPVAGELYLTTPTGQRHVVELSGHGSTIATDDVHLYPGYHAAQLVLRESGTHRVIDFVDLSTLLVLEGTR